VKRSKNRKRNSIKKISIEVEEIQIKSSEPLRETMINIKNIKNMEKSDKVVSCLFSKIKNGQVQTNF
jgi:hypothetical protein